MQLLYLTDHWFRALERGEDVTAVFLDFRKASDRVWHPGLLYQLVILGLSERSNKWLTSYLSERQISVCVGSTMTEYKWCPRRQGSHFGPVLFIVFISFSRRILFRTLMIENIPESLLSTGVVKRQESTFSPELVHLHWQAICMLPSTTLTISDIKPALTPEQTKSIKPKFSSFQLVPYRPTGDEVVHSKHLGNKVLVDLHRSKGCTVKNWTTFKGY